MIKNFKSTHNSQMGVKRDHDSLEKSSESTCITEDEAALYDRQIRLWGLNCQKRLRDAKILVIGLNGLGVEVVKNLALSGVKSITIMDETPVSELDYSAQYFVVDSEPGSTRAEASKASIQELNPNVTITIDKDAVDSKDSRFFAEFSVVFATSISVDSISKVNRMCHEQEVLFYCGETWGFYGYGFLDLLKHKYSKKLKINDKEETVFRSNNTYCTFENALSAEISTGNMKITNNVFILFKIIKHFHDTNKRLPSPLTRDVDYDLLKASRDAIITSLQLKADKVSDEMLKSVFGELSPVCAAVGGIMANEIIKGISGQGEPLCNFLFFDGDNCTGVVQKIVPVDKPPE